MEARSNNSSNTSAINKSSLDSSEVLIVNEVNFTPTELTKLAEYLEKYHIVEVSFRDCIFPDNEFIAVLSKAASLQRVDLSDNPLTFEQALEILVLGSNKLTHLNLSNTVDFYDRFIDHNKTYKHVAALPSEIINLERKKSEIQAAMDDLKNQPAPSKWSFFNFVSAKREVGAEDQMKIFNDMREVASIYCSKFWRMVGAVLMKTQTLQSLDLSNNISNINGRHQLGNFCMKIIAPGLEVNRTLKSLALGQNDLTHHSLTVMADALMKNTNIPLETLDLHDNEIDYNSDHPVGSLTQLLEMPHCSIRTLVLSQEVPFPLTEICESIAKNPQSKLSKLVAEFTMLTGPIVPIILDLSDAAITKLHAVNSTIDITTNHAVRDEVRMKA